MIVTTRKNTKRTRKDSKMTRTDPERTRMTHLPVGVAADPPLPLLEEVPTPELRDRTSSFPRSEKHNRIISSNNILIICFNCR